MITSILLYYNNLMFYCCFTVLLIVIIVHVYIITLIGREMKIHKSKHMNTKSYFFIFKIMIFSKILSSILNLVPKKVENWIYFKIDGFNDKLLIKIIAYVKFLLLSSRRGLIFYLTNNTPAAFHIHKKNYCKKKKFSKNYSLLLYKSCFRIKLESKKVDFC